jgi:predicted nucleotidyltransferase component of viral defense system
MAVKLDLNLHKRILVTLLIEISKKLNGKIAFKGGTCAYLFYNLNRFSFDLDFDILEELKNRDIDEIREILTRNGRIKDFYQKEFTIFFLFDYGRDYPNIKIEFNKRIWGGNRHRIVWFMGQRMKIVDEATFLTNKLVALTNRKRIVSRDLFDTYYFLNLNFPINEDLIKERVRKNKKEYLEYLIDFIQRNYTPKNILQGLGEILNEKQKVWVKKELILATIEEIRKRIDAD